MLKLRQFPQKYFLGLLTTASLCWAATEVAAEDCVVLLHGLASHEIVMKPIAVVLDLQPELRVNNHSYNSYKDEIAVLARETLPKAMEGCNAQPEEKIHFVTHSMGALLLRAYLSEKDIENLGRVVMIAPPNKGSEVVDLLHKIPGLAKILGPAGEQLTTDEKGVPKALASPEMDLGVIAGVRKEQWILGRVVAGQDDGKVSVQSATLDTMKDFTKVESSHTGVLVQKETIEQVLSFLRYGKFNVTQFPDD